MKQGKKLLGLLIILSLFLAFALNPVSGMAAEKTVTWLVSGGLTGPGAAVVVPIVSGMVDCVKDINAKGGVEGIKINLITIDDRYDVARGISVYHRYRKLPRLVYVTACSTGLTKALLPLVNRDKVSIGTPGGGTFQANIGRAFIMNPPYQDAFGAALDWMVADWKKKGNSGTPIVGYMGWDNPAGKEALIGGAQHAEQLGVKILQPEYYPPSSLKHDIWLTRIAKQGANYLYIQGVDPGPTNIIRDAYALGITKKLQILCDVWGPMSSIGVKTYSKELEGTVEVASFVRGDERLKNPMARLWKTYRKRPPEEMSPSYLLGVARVMIFEAALKGALKDVGYEKLNGDVIYQALQKLTGQDVTNGIHGRVDYSPTSRRSSREVKFYRIKDGKYIALTGWVKAPDTIALTKK